MSPLSNVELLHSGDSCSVVDATYFGMAFIAPAIGSSSGWFGLTTVNLFADDVPAAVAWYTELLGTEAYFVREVDGKPAYVEFRIGDYQHELGIVDSRFSPHARPDKAGGAVTYWHVDGVQAAFERLLSLGAKVHQEPIERAQYNQHYLDILESRAGV